MKVLLKVIAARAALRGSLPGCALAILAALLASFAHGAAPLDRESEMVIVPYDSTKPIDEQQPDQFYLPYERFLRLWDAAKQNRARPASEPAIFSFAVTAARYDGVQGERSVAFTGKLDITTANNAWVRVPLPFQGVRIGGLKIDGAAAAFHGDSILIEKPGRHTVEIAFEVPLNPVVYIFELGIVG